MSAQVPCPMLSRRTVLGAGLGVAVATTASACGGGAGGGDRAVGRLDLGQSRSLVLPTHVPPPVVPGGVTSDVDGVPPMYTTPVREYTVSVPTPPGRGGEVSTFQMLWSAPPRPEAENPFWQEINRRLNIVYRPVLASSDTYNDKLATTIASGEVPDIVFLQDSNAVGMQAIQDGVFADLSDVLAGDGVLRWPNLANVSPQAWTASAKNGHIVGVPNQNSRLNNFPAVRRDALRAAGHDELPQDAEHFAAVFADLARLGEVSGKQVWGIAAYNNLVHSMFEWMFRVGPAWQTDDAGRLVHAIETDAFGEMMSYVNRLWEDGVFHPDALSLAGQAQKVGDLFTSGQVALTMDAFNGFFGAAKIDRATQSTEGAEVEVLVPPAHDGGELLVTEDTGYFGIAAISARAARDEERLHELLGVINFWRAPFGSQESLFLKSGLEGVNFTFGPEGELVKGEDAAADNDRDALQYLGPTTSPVYNVPTASLPYAEQFYRAYQSLMSNTVRSPVLGLYSPTTASASGRLNEIDTSYRNGFVSGRTPLSQLDTYRAEWRAAGGDAIRAELQAALEAR